MGALMRKLISILIMILVIASIAPFMLPLKNGEPLLKWSQLSIPGLPQFPDLSALTDLFKTKPENRSIPVTSYKWLDSEGNWQLSDTPPKNGRYETVIVDPNTNLLQADIPAPKIVAPPSTPVKDTSAQPAYSPAMAYDPEKVSAIMDSARNVEKILQQRKAQQDKLLQTIQ